MSADDPGEPDESDEPGENADSGEPDEHGDRGEPDESGDGGEPDDPGEPGEESSRRAPSTSKWRPAFAVTRAVVVLAVAAVGYQAVIPSNHIVRSRLARLALTEPGVAGYNVKPANAGEQPAAQTGLTALVSAAKRSPNETGVYAIEWAPSQPNAAGDVVLLLPTRAQAAVVLSEVRAQQLAVKSYSSEGLVRRSTYTVDGIPGATGSVYTASATGAASMPGLVVTSFQFGRAVVVSEALSITHTQADADTIASNEYARLRRVEPGFTLNVVDRPMVATILWGAGAVALAAVVALGPLARRRRMNRRQRRIEEELSRLVVVHGRAISKHHR